MCQTAAFNFVTKNGLLTKNIKTLHEQFNTNNYKIINFTEHYYSLRKNIFINDLTKPISS